MYHCDVLAWLAVETHSYLKDRPLSSVNNPSTSAAGNGVYCRKQTLHI